MEKQEFPSSITIAYYPFRAKAQVLRILCEYLHLPYQNKFISPDDWRTLKESQDKRWFVRDLPYIEHEDFVLTGNTAMITYVVELASRQDLLGRNLEDKVKVDLFKSKGCLNILLGFICSSRAKNHSSRIEKKNQLNNLFEKKLAYIMNRYQRQCHQDSFFLGYLTIIDFFIYEIMNYFKILFPEQLNRYQKLSSIRDKVAALPEIQNYEASPRVVGDYCPIRYFKKFKEEKKKIIREMNNSDSTNNGSACQEQIKA